MSVRVSNRLLLAAILLGTTAPFCPAQTSADAITAEVQNVFQRCHPAVVRIEELNKHGKMAGTGFFIDPNGTLYTSYTIACGADELTVVFNGKRYPATRLMADPRSGIALLRIDAETPFLATGKTSEMSVATPVMIIGYPMDLGVSPSFGLVSGFDMKYKGRFFSTTHIRASIAVSGGQGGSPMLNLMGEAVGILISSAVGGGSCFALPIEAAEKVRADYVRFGQPRPGYLGAELTTIAESGTNAQITRVDEAGPAAKAGLQTGDVLISIANRRVTAPEDVINAAFYISAGDEVPVTIIRNGEQKEFTVKAADRPSKEARVVSSGPNIPTLLKTPAIAGGEAQPSLTCDPDLQAANAGLQMQSK